jgi:hypothetical protein
VLGIDGGDRYLRVPVLGIDEESRHLFGPVRGTQGDDRGVGVPVRGTGGEDLGLEVGVRGTDGEERGLEVAALGVEVDDRDLLVGVLGKEEDDRGTLVPARTTNADVFECRYDATTKKTAVRVEKGLSTAVRVESGHPGHLTTPYAPMMVRVGGSGRRPPAHGPGRLLPRPRSPRPGGLLGLRHR